MIPIWPLELAGVALVVLTLWVIPRSKPAIPRDVRPVLLALLAVTGLSHLFDTIEWLGYPVGDRLGDVISVFRPALWAFLLFSLARSQLVQRVLFQEQQLRFYLEHTPASVAVFDRQLRYMAYSHKWLSTYHGPVDGSLVGADVTSCLPELAPFLKDVVQRALDCACAVGDSAPLRIELDGKVEWVRWAASPWMRGESVGGIVVLADVVSEEVEADERLLHKREEVSHADLLQTVSILASSIAHDLRNFLLVIAGHAELMAAPDATQAQIRESSAAIRTAVDASSALLDSLRTSTRTRDSTPPQAIQLCPVLQESERLLLRFLPTSISLRVSVPPNLQVWSRCTPVELHQVLLNLAVNARDAMPDGGALSIELAVDESDSGKLAAIAVADTGAGISPELQPKVFERLFTTKPVGKGSGLGLSIVQSIVEQAGGTVSLVSKQGEGTTVTVSLPCSVTPDSRPD